MPSSGPRGRNHVGAVVRRFARRDAGRGRSRRGADPDLDRGSPVGDPDPVPDLRQGVRVGRRRHRQPAGHHLRTGATGYPGRSSARADLQQPASRLGRRAAVRISGCRLGDASRTGHQGDPQLRQLRALPRARRPRGAVPTRRWNGVHRAGRVQGRHGEDRVGLDDHRPRHQRRIDVRLDRATGVDQGPQRPDVRVHLRLREAVPGHLDPRRRGRPDGEPHLVGHRGHDRPDRRRRHRAQRHLHLHRGQADQDHRPDVEGHPVRLRPDHR